MSYNIGTNKITEPDTAERWITMSKFSVDLTIGGNWANGVTYVQQATIIVEGRTLKEVEEKAISIYCDNILKHYGDISNIDVTYIDYDKTTESTCNTCGKCVCQWSITARARRMKKDESYTYAHNYTGVRHYYNGLYNGYTTENICYIAFDPEYNKAETTAEATAETTEATAQPTEETTQPDTAERGIFMKKYNIKVTARGVELNTLSSMPTSFTLTKNYIIEAKDKEDAKQKGREKFIAETLYKGSIYGEYTGERRVAPFMEGFADDHSGKYEDITKRDYFVYRWHINVFVKQYRKPRTKPEAEATAETTEATAETTEATAETTEATAETTEATAEATAETTEATAEPTETTQPTETETTTQPTETETTEATAQTTEETTQTKYDYNTSYPTTEETTQTAEATAETTEETAQTAEAPAETKAMLNSCYGMCVTAPPPTETTGQPTEETAQPTGATPPPTEATAEPTETTQPTETETTTQPPEAKPPEATKYRTGRGILSESGRGILSEAFHRATKSTPPPPIISTRKGVNGVTIREHRQYNNGIEKVIVHKGFYNFDELISWYQHNDPSFLCTYKHILFGCDNVDYYASSFIYESEYL